MENLLLATPVPPDFLYCDLSYSYFGAPFQLADCLQAEALMPRGDHPVRYHHTDNDVPTVEHDVELPLSYRYGARSNQSQETYTYRNAKVLSRDVPNRH